MAFKSGALSMSANFTVGFAGPVDSRQVCDYTTDLVAIQYPYAGMIVTVINETDPTLNGVYVLKTEDPTDSTNWLQAISFE